MEFVRSLLFVPGHQSRMLEKAFAVPADGVILDLEDAVPAADKESARAAVAGWLEQSTVKSTRLTRLVRVSSLDEDVVIQDLDAVLRPGLDVLCLPKVQHVADIQRLDRLVGERETQAGLEAGSVRFMVTIETALGLLNAPAIAAASPRIAALMFGGEDFSADLGLPVHRVEEAREMLYARSSLAVAAASVHVPAIDTVWTDFRDPGGLREEATLARRLGFSAKPAIHPAQLETINEVFSPDAEEVENARRVMTAVEEAGSGAIALDGQMIDAPVVHRAHRVLARAAMKEERALREGW